MPVMLIGLIGELSSLSTVFHDELDPRRECPSGEIGLVDPSCAVEMFSLNLLEWGAGRCFCVCVSSISSSSYATGAAENGLESLFQVFFMDIGREALEACC